MRNPFGHAKQRRRRKQAEADRVGFWWHSIDLGDRVVTPGFKSQELLAQELALIDMPERLDGLSVLDIGAWDGYFSFEAERRGATRVLAVDHYVWSLDLPGQQAHWRSCMEAGVAPDPYHESEFWHPEALPGKVGFDTARSLRASRVEDMVQDFMTCDLAELGQWDLVLYMGVLYHMEDPLGALRRLAAVTRGIAIVETEAIVVPGLEHDALWRFFPGAELNADVSNWWAPNLTALKGALAAAGFAEVDVKVGPPENLDAHHSGPVQYRAIVHAMK
jgi:tRNA (mo5U34)-methyltransferase